MLRSIHIKNFRCFRDLKLDSLERVNLIAGQNNVGKTALLEGIYLHLRPDTPDLGLRTAGLTFKELDRSRLLRRSYEEAPDISDLWAGLFYNYALNSRIELTGQYEDAQERTLVIRNREPKGRRPLSEFVDSENDALSDLELVFAYYMRPGPDAPISVVSITQEGRFKRHTSSPIVMPSFFRGTRYNFDRGDAANYSKLEMVGRQEEIVATLTLLEPRLKRLTVLVVGKDPTIHGDIGIGRLLPVPNMGEGMGRLLSIALAIANTEHGVVLIDEIENGLHYSVMAKVWAAIAQAARAADVQIFATTHSWECITAAHEAFSSSEVYDFRLHRLDRVNEDIRAVTYTQTMLETAIQSGLEVR